MSTFFKPWVCTLGLKLQKRFWLPGFINQEKKRKINIRKNTEVNKCAIATLLSGQRGLKAWRCNGSAKGRRKTIVKFNIPTALWLIEFWHCCSYLAGSSSLPCGIYFWRWPTAEIMPSRVIGHHPPLPPNYDSFTGLNRVGRCLRALQTLHPPGGR